MRALQEKGEVLFRTGSVVYVCGSGGYLQAYQSLGPFFPVMFSNAAEAANRSGKKPGASTRGKSEDHVCQNFWGRLGKVRGV